MMIWMTSDQSVYYAPGNRSFGHVLAGGWIGGLAAVLGGASERLLGGGPAVGSVELVVVLGSVWERVSAGG